MDPFDWFDDDYEQSCIIFSYKTGDSIPKDRKCNVCQNRMCVAEVTCLCRFVDTPEGVDESYVVFFACAECLKWLEENHDVQGFTGFDFLDAMENIHARIYVEAEMPKM